MKKVLLQTKWVIALFCIQFVSMAATAQVKYHAKDNVQSIIKGTSTLHDWSMQASKGECIATFTLNAAEKLTGLQSLFFSMPVEGLKSDHSAMDKNAYKALKTSQYPVITYNLSSASLAPDGSIKCQGKLTIAGTTVDAGLLAFAKVNPDKSIAISGTKKISMKDFNIEPPTFMLGAIKTGNDITLQFDLTLAKQ